MMNDPCLAQTGTGRLSHALCSIWRYAPAAWALASVECAGIDADKVAAAREVKCRELGAAWQAPDRQAHVATSLWIHHSKGIVSKRSGQSLYIKNTQIRAAKPETL